MKFVEQRISGVWLIEPELHTDERGVFRRQFCEREYVKHGLNPHVRQTNISENRKRRTLRGFHYQIAPRAECKTMSCLRGSLHVIVVDLRPDSITAYQWLPFRLDSESRSSLYVPEGCANAFLTLEDNTLIHYCMSEVYSPESARGIRYNDPFFQFRWPDEPVHISDRDRNFPDFHPPAAKQPHQR